MAAGLTYMPDLIPLAAVPEALAAHAIYHNNQQVSTLLQTTEQILASENSLKPDISKVELKKILSLEVRLVDLGLLPLRLDVFQILIEKFKAAAEK